MTNTFVDNLKTTVTTALLKMIDLGPDCDGQVPDLWEVATDRNGTEYLLTPVWEDNDLLLEMGWHDKHDGKKPVMSEVGPLFLPVLVYRQGFDHPGRQAVLKVVEAEFAKVAEQVRLGHLRWAGSLTPAARAAKIAVDANREFGITGFKARDNGEIDRDGKPVVKIQKSPDNFIISGHTHDSRVTLSAKSVEGAARAAALIMSGNGGATLAAQVAKKAIDADDRLATVGFKIKTNGDIDLDGKTVVKIRETKGENRFVAEDTDSGLKGLARNFDGAVEATTKLLSINKIVEKMESAAQVAKMAVNKIAKTGGTGFVAHTDGTIALKDLPTMPIVAIEDVSNSKFAVCNLSADYGRQISMASSVEDAAEIAAAILADWKPDKKPDTKPAKKAKAQVNTSQMADRLAKKIAKGIRNNPVYKFVYPLAIDGKGDVYQLDAEWNSSFPCLDEQGHPDSMLVPDIEIEFVPSKYGDIHGLKDKDLWNKITLSSNSPSEVELTNAIYTKLCQLAAIVDQGKLSWLAGGTTGQVTANTGKFPDFNKACKEITDCLWSQFDLSTIAPRQCPVAKDAEQDRYSITADWQLSIKTGRHDLVIEAEFIPSGNGEDHGLETGNGLWTEDNLGEAPSKADIATAVRKKLDQYADLVQEGKLSWLPIVAEKPHIGIVTDATATPAAAPPDTVNPPDTLSATKAASEAVHLAAICGQGQYRCRDAVIEHEGLPGIPVCDAQVKHGRILVVDRLATPGEAVYAEKTTKQAARDMQAICVGNEEPALIDLLLTRWATSLQLRPTLKALGIVAAPGKEGPTFVRNGKTLAYVHAEHGGVGVRCYWRDTNHKQQQLARDYEWDDIKLGSKIVEQLALACEIADGEVPNKAVKVDARQVFPWLS